MNTIQAVIIDKREPDWVKSLNFGVPTIGDILDAGDLQIATSDSVRLVIERKTPSDFLNSIADNRLLNQTARMREISDWCYVVVTGALPFDPETRKMISISGRKQKVTGWGVNAVQGFIRTLHELGIFVEQCASNNNDASALFPDARYIVLAGNEENNFASHMIEIAGRERGEVRICPVRPSRILSAGEALLASLPGIGLENTAALLKHCGSPAWTLHYLTMIGEGDNVVRGEAGIRRSARRALGLADGLELVPRSPEENKECVQMP